MKPLNHTDHLYKIVQTRSASLAKEIADLKLFDVNEMTLKIELRIADCLNELIRQQANDWIEKQKTLHLLLKKYPQGSVMWQRVQTNLGEVNLRIKEFNRFTGFAKDFNEYKALITYLRKNDNQLLEEFFKIKNENPETL